MVRVVAVAGAVGGLGAAGIVASILVLLAEWRWRVHRSSRPPGSAACPQPELAQLADLVAVGLLGGATLAQVLPALSGSLPASVDAAVGDALRRHDSGRPLAEALHESLEPLGSEADQLAQLFGSHDMGVAVGNDLLAWSGATRTAHRQRVETAARQLPVRMLAPLLLCILPAFLSLTVVPLVIEGFRAVLG